MGPHSVKSKSLTPGGKVFQNCKIWYPAELENATNQYPVVIFANGTGVPSVNYEALFEHLATWGFIAVGNDDKNSWSGLSSSQSLALVLAENNDHNSVFYQKVNPNQIGLSRHSQGGVGVNNAVTNQANSNVYRSVFGASTTKHELVEFLKWPYTMGTLTIPYFAVAGTGAFDAGDGKDKKSGIAPLWSMIDMSIRFPEIRPPSGQDAGIPFTNKCCIRVTVT